MSLIAVVESIRAGAVLLRARVKRSIVFAMYGLCAWCWLSTGYKPVHLLFHIFIDFVRSWLLQLASLHRLIEIGLKASQGRLFHLS